MERVDWLLDRGVRESGGCDAGVHRAVDASRVGEARIVAAAPLALADIIEASQQLHSGVVSAWLNDLRQPVAIDAKRLAELADAHVPAPVIDMMVALAYPDAFAVPPS